MYTFQLLRNTQFDGHFETPHGIFFVHGKCEGFASVQIYMKKDFIILAAAFESKKLQGVRKMNGCTFPVRERNTLFCHNLFVLYLLADSA
jgi:hypothetical protein